MICVALEPLPVIAGSSSCCVTAGSTATGRPPGPSSAASGSTAQRLEDSLAHLALEQILCHLDGIERQLDLLDAELERIARSERWADQVDTLTRFRGISTLTALGLIAEIGDFARFSHPHELASWLGITPSAYSSGESQHRGHITKAGNTHARRLLVEAAWHYRHPPRGPATGPAPDQRAWQAQVRLHHRYRHLTHNGKRTTVTNIAIARELPSRYAGCGIVADSDPASELAETEVKLQALLPVLTG